MLVEIFYNTGKYISYSLCIYCCYVILHVSHTAAAPTVDVEERFRGHLEAKGGSMFIISANMTGVPAPNTTWFHNDKVIEQTATTSTDTGVSYTTLRIGRVVQDTAGKYKVVVENSIGSDSAEFDVIVKGKFDSKHYI